MKGLISILFFMPIILHGQVVNIPDINFLEALISVGADLNNDSQIQLSEAFEITSLDIESQDISDLTGIEAFSELANLNCSHNQISEVDISNNTELAILDISYNQLSQLDVSSNLKLSNLACDYNRPILILDFTSNINLVKLSAQSNGLEQLLLGDNSVLDSLYITNNRLTNLDISGLPGLRRLYCTYNILTKLDITENRNMEVIQCGNNLLKELDLSNSENLFALDVNNNLIEELQLELLPKLEFLICDHNPIIVVDLSHLETFEYLVFGPELDFIDLTHVVMNGPVIVYTDEDSDIIVCEDEAEVESLSNVIIHSINEDFITILSENCNQTITLETSELKDDFVIYPNPTESRINIDSESIYDYSVSLYDYNGRCLEYSQNPTFIDVSKFHNGLYLLRILNEENMKSRSFPIQIE